MNKFIEDCKKTKTYFGFVHKIPLDLYDDYLKAIDEGLVKLDFSPYGDTYIVINQDCS